ncbi:MAG: N-acetyl-gamma-glutamyl-phosphate reductase [Rhodothermales bacterium]|nr:N-acetyl-gamma-glutamyl-phosphate reductase [Rhodothermales bacterium]
MTRAAILHGAGYTGRELIKLLLGHPRVELAAVTSRTFARQPLWDVHSAMRGTASLSFSAPDEFSSNEVDAVFIAAEHGQGAVAAKTLIDGGYRGHIIDLSADFRLPEKADYEQRYERTHPAPELAGTFTYGMADLRAPYPEGTTRIANPGCFATGLALSLTPFARAEGQVRAAVTALTGASGSGAGAKSTTHFPDRQGNVRAYKVFSHQHEAELTQLLGSDSRVDFVPVSGPWTRGIWGTAQILGGRNDPREVFEEAYAGRPLVRLWPDQLPELRWSVGTPFCDIGWVRRGEATVVGFGLDNLLKGAASQAVHNLNLIAGWPETLGLLPEANPVTA